ncbi:thiol-activated cytolysin family protein [Maribacter confluentis]|uniref:Thiol-activated cytolysin family protein n=1 Tax=Maribacter confluentis TaxID=1656093 RepID=A0ABT8RJH1_9FLAO|nr:thiol-activated cytolysin family protein [Maribacter confluentis]MDO1511174.1 thiol-activated cytolysin family protein [Maribacter confluentis]
MRTNQSFFRANFYVTVFGLVLTVNTSCSKDEPDVALGEPKFNVEDAMEFNGTVASLKVFDQPVESPVVETESSNPERDKEDTTLECTTKTFKGAPGFNEMFTLDPTTDVIYPGALLKGETIPTGEYQRISGSRAPITISASLQNIKKVKVEIENPDKLSNVRQGIADLLNQEVNGATAAAINLEIEEVHSAQHLEASVGVNYRGVGKKVSNTLDFSSSSYKNTFVLKFIQRYYTLDVDTPGKSPSDLFTELPNIAILGGTNPVYVSSVQYGRMVLYTVESNFSKTDVKNAFDASVGSTDGTIDVEYQNIINSSNIQALIIGGSGDGAVQAINGPGEVYNFIAEGGNYSKDSPGAPLAYKLNYVKEGFPVAKVVLSTEYQIRDCDLAYPEYQVTIDKITGDQPSDTEVNGELYIKMKVGSSYLGDGLTWSKSASNHVEVQNDKTHSIGSIHVFKPYRPNRAIDQIEFSGELKDYNGIFGNPSLGVKFESIKLDTLKINEEMNVTLSYNAKIKAHFKAVRIK